MNQGGPSIGPPFLLHETKEITNLQTSANKQKMARIPQPEPNQYFDLYLVCSQIDSRKSTRKLLIPLLQKG